jgi:hypothetical protein
MRLVREKPKFFTIIGSGERMWVLTLRTLQTSRSGESSIFVAQEVKPPEVPKLIWVIDLRMPGNYPDHQIYNIVSPTLTTSGGQRFGSTKTPEEVPKLMWTMDLRILRDPSRPFDHGDASINVEILWEPMCRVTGLSGVPLRVAHTGIQRTLERKLRAEESKQI